MVINMYGGPGTGKSTNAALLFAQLKEAGVNAELVQEYVKQWAWENRKPINYDQFYFFGKQARKEYSLFNQVDTIITDSPVSLCAYYAQLYGTEEQKTLFIDMAKTYYKMVAESGQTYVHIWLKRVKPYNPKGRFQTEAEAKDIDGHMKTFMVEKLGLTFIEVEGSYEGVQKIQEIISGVSSTDRGYVYDAPAGDEQVS